MHAHEDFQYTPPPLPHSPENTAGASFICVGKCMVGDCFKVVILTTGISSSCHESLDPNKFRLMSEQSHFCTLLLTDYACGDGHYVCS